MPDKHKSDYPEHSARELFIAAVGEKYVIDSGSLSSLGWTLGKKAIRALIAHEMNNKFILK